jgi:pimeloyl-ACP methyl ester carboxylesterase
VQQLIPQLPPAVETPGIEPGQPFRIDVEPDDQSLGCSYSVLLPIEYSPQHTYPLVVTLRAEGQSLERMLEWWGGTAELPGLAQRRGYIVIAPEYATPEQGEYAYDSATHFRVLAALNDARRRFPIDSERIYLSGHGMGADAAFDLGFSHPDEFAGVIPICGVCDHYARQYVKNGLGSAWYVVGGELDRDLVARNSGIFDVIMKNYGFKIDFLYAEFVQRGFENYAEELPRIFEWMALHRRLPLPKEMEMRSLRATDRRFFWVVANDLTKTVVLPQPEGMRQAVAPSLINVRITPGTGSGNVIVLDSPSKHYTLWIHPDLVDLEKRVIVKVKTQQKHNAFIDPDVAAMLEDYRERGDRQRLFVAKLEI